MSYTKHGRGVNCWPDLKTEPDNRSFWRPMAIPPARDAPPFQQVKAMGRVREGMASASSPRWTTSSPTTLTGSLVCERAWAGSSGLPSPAFSRLAFSQTGVQPLPLARLPVELAEEAVMHIDAGIEVGMTLVATGGAEEE